MKSDRLYLEHILEAVNKIERYCADGKEAFCRDERTQDAVIRNFEIIGEAAKRLSDRTRNSHPEIPWREVAGFRDVLIHDYMGVKIDLVWNVVKDHLPALRRVLAEMLK